MDSVNTAKKIPQSHANDVQEELRVFYLCLKYFMVTLKDFQNSTRHKVSLCGLQSKFKA